MNENIAPKLNNFNISEISTKGVNFNAQNPDLNIQAHYSDNMKVTRTRRNVNDIPTNLPANHLISPRELDLRMRSIDTDIYEGQKKEKANHDFNSKLYFKIFAGVTIFSAIIACIRKIR